MSRPFPQAIFGGPLFGSSPLRYIYVDEAGTSAREPVTIVAGVILHADKHWRRVETRIQEIIREYVPDHLRKDFTFHAKTIWGDERVREGWPFEKRKNLLNAMMRIPREFGLAVAMGLVRRDPDRFTQFPDQGVKLKGKVSPSELEHCIAFGICLMRADEYVRRFAGPDEVAHVTAEDLPKMKKFLNVAIPLHRASRDLIPVEHIRPTLAEIESGVVVQTREQSISRIVDTVHFVDKKESPILQVADACAFGFRRYFSNQSGGSEFLESIVGKPSLIDEDWQGGMSAGLFYDHAN